MRRSDWLKGKKTFPLKHEKVEEIPINEIIRITPDGRDIDGTGFGGELFWRGLPDTPVYSGSTTTVL